MTVKELIEKLSDMNSNATVILDKDWYTKNAAEHGLGSEMIEYNKKALLENGVTEVVESDDKTYVRLW